PESTNPHKLLVLPTKATPEARVVSLPNTRYNKHTRYLVCPETGIYEFTKISAPRSTPRSWLIVDSSSSSNNNRLYIRVTMIHMVRHWIRSLVTARAPRRLCRLALDRRTKANTHRHYCPTT
ncbi:hypothetical protein I5L01_15830, partial [Erythrobacter sp. YJ-T3-07]|nr:hypothetical protein [Erythrobacter sp. YJ-T3-07]